MESSFNSSLNGDLVENGTAHIYWSGWNVANGGITLTQSTEEDHTGDSGGSAKIVKTGSSMGGMLTQRGNGGNSNCIDSQINLNHLS